MKNACLILNCALGMVSKSMNPVPDHRTICMKWDNDSIVPFSDSDRSMLEKYSLPCVYDMQTMDALQDSLAALGLCAEVAGQLFESFSHLSQRFTARSIIASELPQARMYNDEQFASMFESVEPFPSSLCSVVAENADVQITMTQAAYGRNQLGRRLSENQMIVVEGLLESVWHICPLQVFNEVLSKEEEAKIKKMSVKTKVMDVTGNIKTVKGVRKNVMTGIVYLAPGELSGVNVCPYASGQVARRAMKRIEAGDDLDDIMNSLGNSKEATEVKKRIEDMIAQGKTREEMQIACSRFGCVGACLGTQSGHGVMPWTQELRIRKTQRLFTSEPGRKSFLNDVDQDIMAVSKKAEKIGMVPSFRLNGTSDIDYTQKRYWPEEDKSFFDKYPNINFYDYTKSFGMMQRYLRGNMPGNYHLTYSYTGYNWENCTWVLKAGGNVAIAFRIKSTDAKPLKFDGWECIDGDESDVRFDDKPSTIVALSAKGRSINMIDTMIVSPDDPRITWPKNSPYAKLQSDTELQKKFRSEAEKTDTKDLQRRLMSNRWYKVADAVIKAVNSDKDLYERLFGKILAKRAAGKNKKQAREEAYKAMHPGLIKVIEQITPAMDVEIQKMIKSNKPSVDILDIMASRIARGSSAL